MKKATIFLIICYTLSYQILSSQFVKRIEAENCRFELVSKVADASASEGYYLSMKDNGFLISEIELPENGYYKVKIGYRANGGDKEQYFLKNNDTIPIGFGISPEWATFEQNFYFKKGENQLGLLKSWGNIDFDFFEISDVIIQPEIAPKLINYYKEGSKELLFKVQNYHQTIKNCYLGKKKVKFDVVNSPYQESVCYLKIKSEELNSFNSGKHIVKVKLEKIDLKSEINIFKAPQKAKLKIITPDVEHGTAVLIKLPNGHNMLIDCAKSWVRDSILIPMLKRHQVDTIHTFILTHYHSDHDSGDKGQKIIDEFNVQNLIDYKTFKTGDEWTESDVKFKVLNSYDDGESENHRSLSFKMGYKGFIYVHGGDTYADNQKKMLQCFPDDIKASVFFANHHFHGSVLPEYIVKTQPKVVLLQAQKAVYARAAFMHRYLIESIGELQKKGHQVETLFAQDYGTIVIRINDKNNWWYETYREQDNLTIPLFNN